MDSAQAGLRRLLDRYASARRQPAAEIGGAGRTHIDAFDEAISYDLNTARALATVASAARDDRLSDGELTSLAALFDPFMAIGLTNLEPGDLDLKGRDVTVTEAEVNALLAARNMARSAKDFSRSDRLRDQLTRSYGGYEGGSSG